MFVGWREGCLCTSIVEAGPRKVEKISDVQKDEHVISNCSCELPRCGYWWISGERVMWVEDLGCIPCLL